MPIGWPPTRPSSRLYEDDSMARMPDLRKLADVHGIRMCSVEQIIEYRLGRETLVSTIPELTGTVVDTLKVLLICWFQGD